MFSINLANIKSIVKNCSSFGEKQNILALFDTKLLIYENTLTLLLESNNGSCACTMEIENPKNLWMIIGNNSSVLFKILASIKAEYVYFLPHEQGMIQIFTENNDDKKNLRCNFNIHSQNIYLNDMIEPELSSKTAQYDLYFQMAKKKYITSSTKQPEELTPKTHKSPVTDPQDSTPVSYKAIDKFHQAIESEHTIIMENTKQFNEFLKNIIYAASSENDRDFSNIAFQWENNLLTSYASNRIRIAVGRIPTVTNNSNNIVRFSCDKKIMVNVIKACQNFPNEPIIIKILSSSRILFFCGDNMIIEVSYFHNRSMRIEQFFNSLTGCLQIICNTQDVKQAVQAPKTFATKFHYALRISYEPKVDNEHHESNVNDREEHHISFGFSEPNQGDLSIEIPAQLTISTPFNLEVNINYFADALGAVDTATCLFMINPNNNLFFIIPLNKNLKQIEGQLSSNQIQELYNTMHLITCIR